MLVLIPTSLGRRRRSSFTAAREGSNPPSIFYVPTVGKIEHLMEVTTLSCSSLGFEEEADTVEGEVFLEASKTTCITSFIKDMTS